MQELWWHLTHIDLLHHKEETKNLLEKCKEIQENGCQKFNKNKLTKNDKTNENDCMYYNIIFLILKD